MDEPIAPASDAAPATEGVMPEQYRSGWKTRITASRSYLRETIEQGRKNVDRIKQKFFQERAGVDRIAVPDDHFLSQQKIAQIFYRVPEVQLGAKVPGISETAAPIFQVVLNEYLDAEHANVKAGMDEGLTDLITAVGFGAFKVGYESTTVEVDADPDPLTGQPQIDPATGLPAKQLALVHEAYVCQHIPPGRMLFQPDFIGSDFDRAGYLGFRFIEDVPPGTPGAQTTQISNDEDLLSKPSGEGNASRTYRIVDAMWFKAALFTDTVKDPEEIWEFEWVHGEEAPRTYRKCPYKKFPGFPVKVLTTKYISDTAIPLADTTVTRNLVDAKSIGLSHQLVHRERTLPQNLIDTTRVGPDVLAKIERNVSDAFIGVDMPITEDLVRPLVKGQLPNEHYVLEHTLDGMVRSAWSMNENQTGTTASGTHTATELTIVEGNKNTRLGYEQDKVVVFFLTKIVRCIAALIQQYAPQDGGYVKVLGQDGAASLMKWSAEQIQGDFSFKIKANSQLRPDAAAELQRATAMANYCAKSPYVNQPRLWSDVIEAFGKSPEGYIVQPPPPKPEPPPLSLKGDDLNPLMPQYANVYAIMQQFWNVTLPISPLAQAPAMPMAGAGGGAQNMPTESTAELSDVLTKHANSGELPGGGAMVANAAKVM